jgi:colicin import membrane protein
MRASLETQFREQHGERPEKAGLFGNKQKAWDRAHSEIDTAVQARREFLRSDDPRAVGFRENAWETAREGYEAKHEQWSRNRWAAIQQAGPQHQQQPQEQSDMSNNTTTRNGQEQTLNRENERRKAQQEQMRRLQEARRQQEQEQEKKRQQERSQNQTRGMER